MFIKLQEKQNLLLKAVEIPLQQQILLFWHFYCQDTTFLAFLLQKKVVYTAKKFGRVGISDIWIHVYQSYQLFVLLNSIKVTFCTAIFSFTYNAVCFGINGTQRRQLSECQRTIFLVENQHQIVKKEQYDNLIINLMFQNSTKDKLKHFRLF